MAAKFYSKFPLNMGGGDAGGEGPMDLLSDTIKTMLRTSHTPDQTGDEVKADLPADEASQTGYSAGGYTLANKTYTTSSLVTTFDNTVDPNWSITGALTVDTAITWDDTPTSPADPLICYDDTGDQTVTNGTLTYGIHASGIFAITVA